MTSQPTDRTGGCQCGAVRYRITGEPRSLSVCHCTDCQHQSGSAFGMSLIIDRGHFEISAGTPKMFTKTAASGRKLECAFCPDCGNRLFHLPEFSPDALNVKPGTLDDTSQLVPALHIWTSSKQPWVVIPAGTPQFERNPGE